MNACDVVYVHGLATIIHKLLIILRNTSFYICVKAYASARQAVCRIRIYEMYQNLDFCEAAHS